jgi:hypothetical protein
LAFLFLGAVQTSAQLPTAPKADSPQTLQWVQRQSDRIESQLSNAMRSSEPVEILIQLADCYQIFDVVAMAGLYCTNVRVSAEAGRRQCDVINYRLEQDLNSKLERAVEARKHAARMKEAAIACLSEISAQNAESAFTPNDLLRHDAHMAELDLLDGMSTKDLHILSQKLEHAIRLLYDVEHLANSMFNCTQQRDRSEKAIEHCQDALGAPNWHDVHESVQLALSEIKAIQRADDCD